MRIRTIKPEWLDDERLVLAPATARVLSVSLIVMADDAGRGRANVTMLAARVFPGETCPRTTAADSLACLVSARFVEVYEVDGQTYYQIRNWAKHQKIDRPKRSQLPPPPCNVAESKDSTSDRRAIVDSSTIHRRAVDDETSEDRDLDRDLDREGNARVGAAASVSPSRVMDRFETSLRLTPNLAPEVARLVTETRGTKAIFRASSFDDREAVAKLCDFATVQPDPLGAVREVLLAFWAVKGTGARLSWLTDEDPGRFLGKTRKAPRKGIAAPTSHADNRAAVLAAGGMNGIAEEHV